MGDLCCTHWRSGCTAVHSMTNATIIVLVIIATAFMTGGFLSIIGA